MSGCASNYKLLLKSFNCAVSTNPAEVDKTFNAEHLDVFQTASFSSLCELMSSVQNFRFVVNDDLVQQKKQQLFYDSRLLRSVLLQVLKLGTL